MLARRPLALDDPDTHPAFWAPQRHRSLDHSALDLEWVATELNDRPRKRLGFAKAIEEIGPLLLR
jgi:hypothetical protein